MPDKIAITAVVLARNEEAAIDRCVRSLSFCEQVIVVDSHSDDRTVEIAEAAGAEILQFSWDGRYPKKKQWGMSHPSVRHNWILHIDADEVVTSSLADEISNRISLMNDEDEIGGFDIPLAYTFDGRTLRFGHRVHKRSLVDRRRSQFPEVGDLSAPGITEVEGHYQPEIRGAVGSMRMPLLHDDPDPLSDWISRHNRYSDWEAYLTCHPVLRVAVRENRSAGGRVFDRVPCKPAIFFVYSFIFRLGFLDGRAGFNYAFGLAWYYWLTSVKIAELRRGRE